MVFLVFELTRVVSFLFYFYDASFGKMIKYAGWMDGYVKNRHSFDSGAGDLFWHAFDCAMGVLAIIF